MTPDLIRRIGFTLAALFLYRVGCHIPLPGIDSAAWAQFIGQSESSLLRGLGSVDRLSPLAFGIIPYFTAAILMQVAIFFSRRVRNLAEQGEAGRVRIARVTLAITILLTVFQSYGFATALQAVPQLVTRPGALFVVTSAATLVAGTLFLTWLADQITLRGLGNGISWLLFAAAISALPGAVAGTVQLVQMGALSARSAVLLALLVVALVGFVVAVELARRDFIVERGDGRGRSMMSVKLNPAGIAPQIFAGWLMFVPVGFALLWQFVNGEQAAWLAQAVQPPRTAFWVLFTVSLTLASLFYTAFLWDPARIAQRLQERGLRLAGITPGEATADALDHSVSRLALAGAAYLVLLIVGTQFFFASLGLPFVFGGFALLVVVSTVLDLKAQVLASIDLGSRLGGERR